MAKTTRQKQGDVASTSLECQNHATRLRQTKKARITQQGWYKSRKPVQANKAGTNQEN